MTINKFGISDFNHKPEVTKTYLHTNFVTHKYLKENNQDFVTHEYLDKYFCQIIAFLIKEKLITVDNLEAFETKWKLNVDECYSNLVERIDPIIQSNIEYIYINPEDPPKTPKVPPSKAPPHFPVTG